MSYFDVEQVSRPFTCCRLVAILDDGSTRYPIVDVSARSPATLAPLVRQLNQQVGGEAATPLKVPGLIRRHRERQWNTLIVPVLFLLFAGAILYTVMFTLQPRNWPD